MIEKIMYQLYYWFGNNVMLQLEYYSPLLPFSSVWIQTLEVNQHAQRYPFPSQASGSSPSSYFSSNQKQVHYIFRMRYGCINRYCPLCTSRNYYRSVLEH